MRVYAVVADREGMWCLPRVIFDSYEKAEHYLVKVDKTIINYDIYVYDLNTEKRFSAQMF